MSFHGHYTMEPSLQSLFSDVRLHRVFLSQDALSYGIKKGPEAFWGELPVHKKGYVNVRNLSVVSI